MNGPDCASAPPPAPSAWRLAEAEIAWESLRHRFCDEGCGEVVAIGIATWVPGRTMTRRVIYLYCERHGQKAAGTLGIRVPPPAGGES